MFVLPVTLVYCGQTVGWIKIKLGIHVGLGPGHIVLDGDPAPSPPKRGHSPTIFGPCLLRPNGWMDQDGTWLGAGPRSRPHCTMWTQLPSPNGVQSPQFSVHVYCGQTAGWIKMALGLEVGLSPGDCVRWGPSPPPHERDGGPSPIFGPFLFWPNGWMHQDATWYGGRPEPRRLCVRWGPSPLPPKGAVAKRLHASKCHLVRS